MIRTQRVISLVLLAVLVAGCATHTAPAPVDGRVPEMAGVVLVTCDPQRWVMDMRGPVGPLLPVLASLPVADLSIAPFALEDALLPLFDEARC